MRTKRASKAHGQEKEINKLNMELIALKQQLIDRDDVNTKTASLLDASKEQKENLEDSLKLYKANNEKNERRLKECIKEISKGNKIIQQLQNDVRNAKSKLKLKSSVIVQQEGVIQKKQEEINDAERALKATETELKRKSIELQQRDEMQRLRDDLNKSKEVNESNQKGRKARLCSCVPLLLAYWPCSYFPAQPGGDRPTAALGATKRGRERIRLGRLQFPRRCATAAAIESAQPALEDDTVHVRGRHSSRLSG